VGSILGRVECGTADPREVWETRWHCSLRAFRKCTIWSACLRSPPKHLPLIGSQDFDEISWIHRTVFAKKLSHSPKKRTLTCLAISAEITEYLSSLVFSNLSPPVKTNRAPRLTSLPDMERLKTGVFTNASMRQRIRRASSKSLNVSYKTWENLKKLKASIKNV